MSDEPAPTGKSPLASRTLWFNLAAAALFFLGQQAPIIRELVGDRYEEIAICLIALGNAILRFVTTEAIAFQPRPEA